MAPTSRHLSPLLPLGAAAAILAAQPSVTGPGTDEELKVALHDLLLDHLILCVSGMKARMRPGAFEVHSIRTGSELLCEDSWPQIHSLN